MIRVFIGVDERQYIAYHVLCSSIMRRSSVPVSITPIILSQCPISRKGLTGFTYARYLVPYFCDYQGKAVFMDSDILCIGDIAEIIEVADDSAVSVVPFDGSLAFERPAVMVFNCDKCKALTPEYIDDETNHPQTFDWAESVGELPPEWNHLVGYMPYNPAAKIIHYTQGVPGYKECRQCDYAREWFIEKSYMEHHVSWLEIMGTSVHAPHVLKRLSSANN